MGILSLTTLTTLSGCVALVYAVVAVPVDVKHSIDSSSSNHEHSLTNSITDSFNFDFSQMTLKNIFHFIASFVLVFGGVLPYVPQYREIQTTQNADGFSTMVCFVQLLANTLRIVFWFGQPFEIALLVQSLVMIFSMFAMVELCVRVKSRNSLAQPHQRKNRYFMDEDADNNKQTLLHGSEKRLIETHFFDFDLKHFWRWTDFISYMECVAVIAILAGVMMYFFISNYVFVQAVGYVALITEAMLATPQLLQNFKKKSTEGMSKSMVFLWFLGDTMKTTYFILTQAPIQFWVCGFIQISIDLLITGQIFYYPKLDYKRFDRDSNK